MNTKIYIRTVEKYLKKDIFAGKTIILYGARQVGKTTLAKKILSEFDPINGKYFDCQSVTTHDFIVPDAEKIKARIGNAKVVVFDEAQYVPEIGLALKVFHDAYPEVQIIATGSSSFDLVQKIGDSMAGRIREYTIYPLSLEEIKESFGEHYLHSQLPTFLRFGSYPGIIGESEDHMSRDLITLQSTLLYKDFLILDGVKKPKLLVDILKLLALQVGSEVSLSSIAKHVNTTVPTVDRYIDILEKMFIIKKVKALSRNPGVEIRKGFKIYFTDLGIRNSILNLFHDLPLRDDIGKLFENFCVMERIKHIENNYRNAQFYFWRTVDKKEIDFVEEENGELRAFEVSWQKKSIAKSQDVFLRMYPNAKMEGITKDTVFNIIK